MEDVVEDGVVEQSRAELSKQAVSDPAFAPDLSPHPRACACQGLCERVRCPPSLAQCLRNAAAWSERPESGSHWVRNFFKHHGTYAPTAKQIGATANGAQPARMGPPGPTDNRLGPHELVVYGSRWARHLGCRQAFLHTVGLSAHPAQSSSCLTLPHLDRSGQDRSGQVRSGGHRSHVAAGSSRSSNTSTKIMHHTRVHM